MATPLTTSESHNISGNHAHRQCRLDTATVAPIPLPPAIRPVGRGMHSPRSPSVLVHPVQSQDSRDEPADGAQEREGEISLPQAAATVEARSAPVEDVSVTLLLATHPRLVPVE